MRNTQKRTVRIYNVRETYSTGDGVIRQHLSIPHYTLEDAQQEIGDDLNLIWQYGLGDEFPQGKEDFIHDDTCPEDIEIEGGHNPYVIFKGTDVKVWYGPEDEDIPDGNACFRRFEIESQNIDLDEAEASVSNDKDTETVPVLPFLNPVTQCAPDQAFFSGVTTSALAWGASYPAPETLPAGLHAYWCEPWENFHAQSEASRLTDNCDRHECASVFAVIVTDHRTEKSDTYIVATTELPLGEQYIQFTSEPCCTTAIYNEEFLPLLESSEHTEKRFQLLESWHNGSDNAVDELYAESPHRDNLEEILIALHKRFLHNGLGKNFPKGTPFFHIEDDGTHRYWLGNPEETIPEYHRTFRIVELNQ